MQNTILYCKDTFMAKTFSWTNNYWLKHNFDHVHSHPTQNKRTFIILNISVKKILGVPLLCESWHSWDRVTFNHRSYPDYPRGRTSEDQPGLNRYGLRMNPKVWQQRAHQELEQKYLQDPTWQTAKGKDRKALSAHSEWVFRSIQCVSIRKRMQWGHLTAVQHLEASKSPKNNKSDTEISTSPLSAWPQIHNPSYNYSNTWLYLFVIQCIFVTLTSCLQ